MPMTHPRGDPSKIAAGAPASRLSPTIRFGSPIHRRASQQLRYLPLELAGQPQQSNLRNAVRRQRINSAVVLAETRTIIIGQRRRQPVTQVMKAGAITYKKRAGSIAPGLEPETRGLRIERGRQPGSSDYLRGSPEQSPAGSRKFRARTGPCPMGRATDCGSEC